MSRICPICGEEYNEPPAISRTDNKTPVCPSCGIREALGSFLKEDQIEEIIRQNRELYRQVNGT